MPRIDFDREVVTEPGRINPERQILVLAQDEEESAKSIAEIDALIAKRALTANRKNNTNFSFSVGVIGDTYKAAPPPLSRVEKDKPILPVRTVREGLLWFLHKHYAETYPFAKVWVDDGQQSTHRGRDHERKVTESTLLENEHGATLHITGLFVATAGNQQRAAAE